MARELRSDRDGSRRGVTISGVIGEKRRREGVSGLQFRPRLGCLSRSLLYRQSGCSRIKRAGKGRRRELGVV